MKKVYAIEKVTSVGDVTIAVYENYDKALRLCQFLNATTEEVYVVDKINVLN